MNVRDKNVSGFVRFLNEFTPCIKCVCVFFSVGPKNQLLSIYVIICVQMRPSLCVLLTAPSKVSRCANDQPGSCENVGASLGCYLAFGRERCLRYSHIIIRQMGIDPISGFDRRRSMHRIVVVQK